MKELIGASRRRVDEEFGRKLCRDFSENKKLFRKEVKKVRGGAEVSSVWVRGKDGELVGDESELKQIWKAYFEELMNNETEGEALVTRMGIEAGRGRVPMQREIDRLGVEKAIARLKCGKAAGMDGITSEMLKYG